MGVIDDVVATFWESSDADIRIEVAVPQPDGRRAVCTADKASGPAGCDEWAQSVKDATGETEFHVCSGDVEYWVGTI